LVNAVQLTHEKAKGSRREPAAAPVTQLGTIVLDGPREAAPPQRVLVHVEPLTDSAAAPSAAPAPARRGGAPGSRLVPLAGTVSAEDLGGDGGRDPGRPVPALTCEP
jgi:hypothetical protein